MFTNFLKVSIRNIIRHKSFSIINITGLAIGLACSILIFLFIIDELSYDKHHEKAQQIYRVAMEGNFQGNKLNGVITGAPVGSTFADEIPEVISSMRVVKGAFNKEEITIELEGKKIIESNLFYVDSSIIDIYTIPFIKGNPKKALILPFTIVITESAAKKYFGDDDPLGKSLNISDQEYTVTGIIEDCPSNSHFHYSILASIVTLPVINFTTWLSNDYSYTYLLLKEDMDQVLVEEKMMEVALKYIEGELKNSFGISLDDFFNAGNDFHYYLQPLTEIHLHSHTDFEIEANSNVQYVYIFSIIAIFILIIACVNFMNLSTARSATRAKEVGVRKVIGANRNNLFKQFLFESIVISLLSLIIAMIIIESILPFFNSFTLKQLSIGYTSNILVIPALILLAIVVGLFSGFYSAGYLSSIKILDVLKGSLLSGKRHSWFRNILVIFQFTISVVLFICTFVIYTQLQFIKNKDIGFRKDGILVIDGASNLGGSYQAFKQELEKIPSLKSVSYSNTLPARMFGGFPCSIENDPEKQTYVPRMMTSDYDFAETYNLKMKEGRFFSREFITDSFTIVINEAAVKDYGFTESAIGKHIVTAFSGEIINWEIIGVVKDFNFRSLHQDVGPLVIINPIFGDVNLISVRTDGTINEEFINSISEVWSKFVADEPFNYYFIEDEFNNMHKEEFRTGELFTVFSILAIFIACLGLLGLVSFIAEQKTKEIGIRKALGSTITKILTLLFKQFANWILIANVVAWPIAYFLMKNWLQNFAYQVNIKWWIFPVSALLALIVALLTVSFQSIVAATRNPVDSLRYE